MVSHCGASCLPATTTFTLLRLLRHWSVTQRRHLATRTGSGQRGWSVFTCKAGDFRSEGPEAQAREEFNQHRRDKGEAVAERKVQVAANVPVGVRDRIDALTQVSGRTRSEELAEILYEYFGIREE